MLTAVGRIGIVCALMLPFAASAEPIRIKLPFFSSDRSIIYQISIKPFVDAVNDEGKGLIEIEVQFSSPIVKDQSKLPQLIADDVIQMGPIVRGRSPDRFSNTAVVELPGLFRSSHEASYVFTKLIAAGALKGYEDFFVIGAFVSDGETIHSHKPVGSIDDLAGLKIRTSNGSEAAVLARLGATPVLMAINQTNDAINNKSIDAATLPVAILFEFGVGRITSNHFLLRLGGAPNALVMNRRVFEGLPQAAQTIIRKYSGEWLADRSAVGFGALNDRILAQLNSDRRRHVIALSPADAAATQHVFNAVIAEWAGKSASNRELLGIVEAELASLRAAQ